jgi:acetolactate synthase-1/2/3 large subunit
MSSTAAATARLIADAGIERAFGLPGGEVLVLIDALRTAGVDFVLMRHYASLDPPPVGGEGDKPAPAVGY